MTTQENMTFDRALAGTRFPVRLLTVALVLTAVTFAGFGWIIFDERRGAKAFQDESLRIEELRGAIAHLDEVLTMSARMAAATGDPQWEERYRRFKPQLDAAIKETAKLGATLPDFKATTPTEEANLTLVAMENRAFARVRAGHKEEAQAILFSPEFEAQKKIYAEGMGLFTSQIRLQAEEHARQITRLNFLSMIGALVVLTISFAAWLSVMRGLQRWRADLEHAVSERRQAEEASRRSHDELEARVEQRTAELAKGEALYHSLVENVPQQIFRKDLAGRFTFGNRRFCLSLGKPLAEILGKTDQDFFPAPLAAKYQRDDQRVVESGQPMEGDEENPQADGKVCFVHVIKIPLRDDAGQIIGTQGISWDITEHRRAQETRREIEDRYRSLVEESPDVIGIYQDGNLVFINSTGARRLGGDTKAALLGRKSDQFIHPDDQADAKDRIRRRLAGETGIYPAEVRYVNLAGTSVPMEVSAAPITFEGKPAVQFIARDIAERKVAAEALRESEQRFSSAFEHAPIGVALVSPEGRWLKVNRALCELVGYSEAELLTRTFQDITHPEDLAGDLENVRRLIAGEIRTYEMEKRYLHKRGHLVTVSLNVSLVRDGQGQPRYFISQIQDITQRKRVENALRESNEKFHQLADNITDAFWIRSPDLREVHYLSPAFERIWGRPVESLYANPQLWADFIFPEDRQRVLDAFAALTGNTRSLDIEYRIVRPGDQIRWVRVRGFQVRDAADKLIRHTGIVTDITERKRHEISALAFSRLGQRLSSASSAREAFDIIKEVSQELFGWDAFRIRLYNAQSDSFYSGFTVDIIAGQPVAEEQNEAVKPGELYRRIIARGGELILRDQPPSFGPGMVPFGDVSRPSAVLMFVPIRSRGHVVGMLSVQSYAPNAYNEEDLKTLQTMADQCGGAFERIWAEAALRKFETRLFQSQKMETVGKLAGGFAHEFNSILTAILGQSELLLGDLPAGSPLVKNATEINKAAGRAATLVRQLLAYGRKQFLRSEILDLNRVIAGLAGMFHQVLGGAVHTQIVPAPGLHAVKADAGQIEQVIINMTMNARDAMPNGGRLTLETSNVSLDRDSVERYMELKPGDYVMLAITDTGTGMSAEVKARAFEPFFSTKGIGQGTGLGLSTCYGIIKQSGGHISVYSEPGRGTTFKIYLPQVAAPPRSPIPGFGSRELPRGTETILLVEDDLPLREMAATLLRRLGYTVLAAADGVEALSLSHQPDSGRIDLLFTDVVMPQMGGKELAERMRALYPRTRILFTSAYTEVAIVHQGVLSQGVPLLQKPFTPSVLALKVREVLDQPWAPEPDPAQKTSGLTKISDAA